MAIGAILASVLPSLLGGLLGGRGLKGGAVTTRGFKRKSFRPFPAIAAAYAHRPHSRRATIARALLRKVVTRRASRRAKPTKAHRVHRAAKPSRHHHRLNVAMHITRHLIKHGHALNSRGKLLFQRTRHHGTV